MKTTNNYVWEKDLSLNDLVLKQKEEIERLNNIINELEKWLETQRYFEYEDPFTGEYAKDEITPIVQTLDKLQELKGDDK